MLRKTLSVVIFGLFLSGCAMPVPLKMASWAIDGVSYLTTQKSLMDHGLSALSGKDCAVMRLATEGSACRTDTIGVAFDENLSPQIYKDLSNTASLCDVQRISSNLPDTSELDRCAKRLVNKFGKDVAVDRSDKLINHLIGRNETDDAAVWIGVRAAMQQSPATTTANATTTADETASAYTRPSHALSVSN